MVDTPTPSDPDSTSQPSSQGLPAFHPALRTGATRALHEAFEREDVKLQGQGSAMAVMFLGAMIARHHADNPEHLVQAAHSMRELMEKMPRFHGIAPVAAEGLTVRVRELINAWRPVELVPEDGPDRTGLVVRFCAVFATFATWFLDRDAPRKEQTGRLFGKMDQRKERLPSGIEKHRINEWGEYEGYFMGVAHHTRSTTIEEFDAMVTGFAEFALGYLRPRTFDDQERVREKITGGEPHA